MDSCMPAKHGFVHASQTWVCACQPNMDSSMPAKHGFMYGSFGKLNRFSLRLSPPSGYSFFVFLVNPIGGGFLMGVPAALQKPDKMHVWQLYKHFFPVGCACGTSKTSENACLASILAFFPCWVCPVATGHYPVATGRCPVAYYPAMKVFCASVFTCPVADSLDMSMGPSTQPLHLPRLCSTGSQFLQLKMAE
jgi:hypothetical protein